VSEELRFTKALIDTGISVPLFPLVSSPTVPQGFRIPCRATELHHFGLYWCLCEERFGREATVARLQELAAVEVQALTGQLTQADAVRMHSVGVELGA
jgi:hypothetical protein